MASYICLKNAHNDGHNCNLVLQFFLVIWQCSDLLFSFNITGWYSISNSFLWFTIKSGLNHQINLRRIWLSIWISKSYGILLFNSLEQILICIYIISLSIQISLCWEQFSEINSYPVISFLCSKQNCCIYLSHLFYFTQVIFTILQCPIIIYRYDFNSNQDEDTNSSASMYNNNSSFQKFCSRKKKKR